ncbi:hypothetical protein SAMD00023353_6000220 [Rosellinia necatrix]|uniref:Uncharacterized protein n=1 Tax=Rosellinia necatrix TaxID=77044 RepID=A0A1S8AAK9_ROSNE|nr:hypothetical protein SAMD00023353_6000220 [Rosellinia necatrix]
MLDPWDELETLQKGRRDTLACARDLENIKDSCIREHGKTHVVECSECWARLINRLRDRYLNSAIKEWFSGRRAFLQELDDLFTKARQHEADLKTIEQRIADEKKEWFRDKVRNLGLHSATRSSVESRTLQQKLNDRDIPTDKLLSELRECLGADPELREEVYSAFSKQVRVAQAPTARIQAYKDVVFQAERDPVGAARSQKYIDLIEDRKPVAEVISAMVRDRQSAKGDLDQKQTLQKKLEELRRARTAHEVSKNKRDQMRQDKARAAMGDAAETLSSCTVCDKPVNMGAVLACPLCHLLNAHFEVLEKPTLFCSEICLEENYDSHVKASHECSSGFDCLNLIDPNSEMEVDDPSVVFCRECVEDLGQPSAFCGLRCYDVSFQRHRDSVHIPEREKRKLEMDDENQLEFSPEDDTRYSARKIEEHVIGLRDAMAYWQERTGASIS